MANDVTMPDCAHEATPLRLTPEERRALVVRIANGGPEALDAFIKEKEAAGEGGIAAALRRMRDALLQQADALRARLEGSISSERERLLATYETELAALEERRRAEAAALNESRGGRERRLQEEMARAELARLVLSAPPPQKLGFLGRVRALLVRVWRALVWLLTLPLRLLARLFGLRRRAPVPGARSATVPVRGGSGVLMEVEAGLGTALLTSADLRRAVDSRVRALPPRERMRMMRDRLLGLENYEDVARRIVETDLAREAERKEQELSASQEELARRLQDIEETEVARKASVDAAIEALERRRQEELAALQRRIDKGPEEAMKEELLAELEGSGLLSRKGDALRPTSRLMERFADIVFAEEAKGLPAARGNATGAFADGDGLFVREPLRSRMEVSHLDMHGTLLRARLRHPHQRRIYDEDVVVYREERGSRLHVVIIFDRSGSMEENDRMLAAKRAVLALWHAVRMDNRRNEMDILAMDTSVTRVTLEEAWESKPRGFTNTGRALREAANLLKASRAERALIYLITDGLPEAYTVDGVDGAGHPEKAMKFALEEARKLRALPAVVGTTLLLLEPEDELFVKAAEKLAHALDGRVVKTDPKELARDVLKEFDRKAAGPLTP